MSWNHPSLSSFCRDALGQVYFSCSFSDAVQRIKACDIVYTLGDAYLYNLPWLRNIHYWYQFSFFLALELDICFEDISLYQIVCGLLQLLGFEKYLLNIENNNLV